MKYVQSIRRCFTPKRAQMDILTQLYVSTSHLKKLFQSIHLVLFIKGLVIIKIQLNFDPK